MTTILKYTEEEIESNDKYITYQIYENGKLCMTKKKYNNLKYFEKELEIFVNYSYTRHLEPFIPKLINYSKEEKEIIFSYEGITLDKFLRLKTDLSENAMMSIVLQIIIPMYNLIHEKGIKKINLELNNILIKYTSNDMRYKLYFNFEMEDGTNKTYNLETKYKICHVNWTEYKKCPNQKIRALERGFRTREFFYLRKDFLDIIVQLKPYLKPVMFEHLMVGASDSIPNYIKYIVLSFHWQGIIENIDLSMDVDKVKKVTYCKELTLKATKKQKIIDHNNRYSKKTGRPKKWKSKKAGKKARSLIEKYKGDDKKIKMITKLYKYYPEKRILTENELYRVEYDCEKDKYKVISKVELKVGQTVGELPYLGKPKKSNGYYDYNVPLFQVLPKTDNANLIINGDKIKVMQDIQPGEELVMQRFQKMIDSSYYEISPFIFD